MDIDFLATGQVMTKEAAVQYAWAEEMQRIGRSRKSANLLNIHSRMRSLYPAVEGSEWMYLEVRRRTRQLYDLRLKRRPEDVFRFNPPKRKNGVEYLRAWLRWHGFKSIASEQLLPSVGEWGSKWFPKDLNHYFFCADILAKGPSWYKGRFVQAGEGRIRLIDIECRFVQSYWYTHNQTIIKEVEDHAN